LAHSLERPHYNRWPAEMFLPRAGRQPPQPETSAEIASAAQPTGRKTSRLSLGSIRLPPFPARAAGEEEHYERTADKFKLFDSDRGNAPLSGPPARLERLEAPGNERGH
jgi:hypothetical protein